MAFPTGNSVSGTKSDTRSSTYKYSTGTQPNGTPSIGNWNTGGSVVGVGDRNGVISSDGSRIGGQMTDPRLTGGPNVWTPQAIAQIGGRPGGLMPMPGGLTPGVAARPIPPVVNPVVAALARRLVPPGVPEEIVPGYTPQRYVNPGAGVDPNGIGRTYTNANVPFGYANSNPPKFNPSGVGGYTNVNKNNVVGGVMPARYDYGGRR